MHVCYEGTILLLFPSLQLLVVIVNNNFSSEIIQSELDAEDIQQLEIWRFTLSGLKTLNLKPTILF